MDEEGVVAGVDVEDQALRRVAGLNECIGELVDLRYGDQDVGRDPDQQSACADSAHAFHQAAPVAAEVVEIHGPREVQVGVRVVRAWVFLALVLQIRLDLEAAAQIEQLAVVPRAREAIRERLSRYATAAGASLLAAKPQTTRART